MCFARQQFQTKGYKATEISIPILTIIYLYRTLFLFRWNEWFEVWATPFQKKLNKLAFSEFVVPFSTSVCFFFVKWNAQFMRITNNVWFCEKPFLFKIENCCIQIFWLNFLSSIHLVFQNSSSFAADFLHFSNFTKCLRRMFFLHFAWKENWSASFREQR